MRASPNLPSPFFQPQVRVSPPEPGVGPCSLCCPSAHLNSFSFQNLSPSPPSCHHALLSIGPKAAAPPSLPGFPPATFGVAVKASSGDSNRSKVRTPLAESQIPPLLILTPWLGSQPPHTVPGASILAHRGSQADRKWTC